MGRSCSRRRVPPSPLARARVVKQGDAVMPGTEAGQRNSSPKGQRSALTQPSRLDHPRVARSSPRLSNESPLSRLLTKPARHPQTLSCLRAHHGTKCVRSFAPRALPVRGKELSRAINAWRRADTRDAAPTQRAAAVARRCSQRRAGEGADRLVSAGEEGWEELPSQPCGVGSLRRI